MLLYQTASGPVAVDLERQILIDSHDWDELVNQDDLFEFLRTALEQATAVTDLTDLLRRPLPPVGSQEIWAAGVTYQRSRTARMTESDPSGGSSFYDQVYRAERPELFMKATAHRAVGPGGSLRLRRDSCWIVPEPELTLLVNCSGAIVGYTIGNDLSCRDIEGENPLYLPQAKTFDRCVALGPAVLVRREPMPPETSIALRIDRGESTAFQGDTELSRMKRPPHELVEFLFREMSFPDGCLLMTGTGIIPPDDFTLEPGDRVSITIDGIGELANSVD